MDLKGKNGSYFHNNYIEISDYDGSQGTHLIDNGSTEDIICRLNGYAIIPLKEYYKLKDEPVPDGDIERIAKMNIELQYAK